MKLLTLALLTLCLVPPAAARPETGVLAVEGGSIAYEVSGKGEPVVLIHGGFGDRRMWDDQFAAFAREFRVVRYDHRGFGASPAPKAAYSPVDDLTRLLDHLGMRRAHVVGNSLGGSLAITFALRHPDRVASLVVVASGPEGIPPPQEAIDSVMAVFKAAEEQGPEKAVELWLAHPMVAVSSAKPGVRERLRTMISDNRAVFRMEHWPSERMTPPAAQRLKEVRARTLVVVGDRDIPGVLAVADAAAAGIPGAKRVAMRGADHLPQMVSPEEFNRSVLAFLRGR